MREADGPAHDRTNRTLARWNEIESLAAGLAVQVLQELARDSEQYMAEVKAATAAKQTLRQLIVMTGEEVSRTAAEPENLVEDLKASLDLMNEMSEETSLRLQMTMDRRSKFVSALSNIMKAIGDTQNTLVSNLK